MEEKRYHLSTELRFTMKDNPIFTAALIVTMLIALLSLLLDERECATMDPEPGPVLSAANTESG